MNILLIVFITGVSTLFYLAIAFLFYNYIMTRRESKKIKEDILINNIYEEMKKNEEIYEALNEVYFKKDNKLQ
jgi:preprotein translocase subunit YajC